MNTAIAKFENSLGVGAIFSGYHSSFGTKNALIPLDHECYLELLAVDSANTAVSKPRWMGVDLLQKDQITRWALKSNQLELDSETLKKIKPEMGTIREGSRKTEHGNLLQWKMIMPLASPAIELLPFMVDWSTSQMHPTDELPNKGCSLIALTGSHPTPEKFEAIFEHLQIDFQITKANEIVLNALIESPKGLVKI